MCRTAGEAQGREGKGEAGNWMGEEWMYVVREEFCKVRKDQEDIEILWRRIRRRWWVE